LGGGGGRGGGAGAGWAGPGRLEPPRGLRAELLQLIRRLKPESAAVRLLEVVADDLLVLEHARTGRTLEPVRETLVEVGARRLGERPVRGVANEEVPEAKRLVAGERRALRPDDVAADERREAVLQQHVGKLGHELAQRAVVEDRALDRRPDEDRALTRRQLLEPRREEGVDLLRDGQLGEVLRDDPTAVLPLERPFVDEHREQL